MLSDQLRWILGYLHLIDGSERVLELFSASGVLSFRLSFHILQVLRRAISQQARRHQCLALTGAFVDVAEGRRIATVILLVFGEQSMYISALEALERLLSIALGAISLRPQSVLDQAELRLLKQFYRGGEVE